MSFIVRIGFDPENKLYFVRDSDIPGLTVEAASIDAVIEIVSDVAPDLLGKQSPDAKIDFRVERPIVAA